MNYNWITGAGWKPVILFVILWSSYPLKADSSDNRFIVQAKTVEKVIRHCNVIIRYPVLSTPKNTEKQYPKINEINKFLKRNFLSLKKYRDKTLCDPPPTKNVKFNFTLEVNYEVKLNDGKIFSVYYAGLDYVYGSAYPNNTFKAFNIDVYTSKLISYKDLFKDKNYTKKINDLIAKNLLKNGIIESVSEFEHDKKEVYDFYLTKDALNIINIYDFHAVQAVEAKIPFSELGDIFKIQ
ncbi:MAG: hypothetical protein H7A23_00100 [Leptospiraceae bacterium]|nr:hypothetical protein [Leptospiraceae bacterium]